MMFHILNHIYLAGEVAGDVPELHQPPPRGHRVQGGGKEVEK